MKLQSITLHPFGCFTDQSWDLAKPLVVIHGPNELGKTTLRQAIFHALFTPTELTRTQLDRSVKPWLPQPDGDHAKVTLTFEQGGSIWTLEKQWGAGQMSRLSDGTTALADPDAVQKRLGEMLVHGEATFRHVLFTGQAELERTFETIKEKQKAGELRDIRDLLQATADASADVDEQRLRQTLAEKIKKAFGRWDEANSRPEPQSGKEKGFTDPWINGVGLILVAWYAWKKLLAGRDRILELERRLDDISRRVAALEDEIRTSSEFVAKYEVLHEGLADRERLEERIPRLRQDVAEFGAAFTSWLQAKEAIEVWTKFKPDIEARLQATKAECVAAQAKANAVALLQSFATIKEAKSECEKAVEGVNAHPHPGEDLLRDVDRLEEAITAAENKLAARTLSWRIETDQAGTVTVKRGTDPAETITIGPKPASGTATARVSVQAAGITLTVESGEEDVDALFRSIADDRAALARLLEASNASSPKDVREMADKHRDCTAEAASHKLIYDGLLQGKTFEQWETEVRAIENLPATRDLAVIDDEIERITKQLTDGDSQAARHAESIKDWESRFKDLETLAERWLEAKNELGNAVALLATLPTLPEDFGSVKEFLRRLADAQRELVMKQRELPGLRQEFGQLTGELGDQRSEDVTEKAASAQRVFNRAQTQGRAYLRIRQELDRLAGAAGVDPLANFSDRVTGLFSRITGGAAALEFKGQLPASVGRDAVSLPPDRLSHGGGGALALAVRLAMAEAYLQGHGGFIMLDDPLVHFDKTRMAVAANILRTFSASTQVLFFTCHDHHAERLEGAGDQADKSALV